MVAAILLLRGAYSCGLLWKKKNQTTTQPKEQNQTTCSLTFSSLPTSFLRIISYVTKGSFVLLVASYRETWLPQNPSRREQWIPVPYLFCLHFLLWPFLGWLGFFPTLLELTELAVKTAESEDVILMQYVSLFGFFLPLDYINHDCHLKW